MNKLPEQIILEILKNEMSLEDNQAWVGYQTQKIIPQTGLFVVVNNIDSRVVSVANTPSGDYADGMTQLIQSVMRENIQIDIFSRDNSALTRRGEVLLALGSVYSEQKQELEEFSIFKIPTTFVNTSSAEGGSNLNRFSIIVACHTWYRSEKVIQSPDYYDNFSTRVDDEQTIGQENGLIEFNIEEQ